MPIGILGKKKYMSRVFRPTGEVVPVTVIHCPANIVKQVKTIDADGYFAAQLAVFPRKKQTKTKSHYFTKELKISSEKTDLKEGSEVTLKDFTDVDNVKVVSISKGKGFQGIIKRHNFSTGPNTHGSKFHRTPGSRGNCKPSRSVKGLKMPGRMGGDQVTLRSVPIVDIDLEQNLIALKGSIPGAKNSFITLIV